MTEPWNVMLIPDAGPLLTLAHADQLDLLFKPGWTVVVVDTVLHEIIRSRSPVSEKLARWVSQSNVPLYQTKVFAKAQSSGIGIGEYQLPKLSDLGLQEAMAELALDSAGMMGLFLLDDHRMVSPPFLVPGNAKKVSTQAYLVYLQQRQHIESAIAVQKAAAIGRRTGSITHPSTIASQPVVEVPMVRQGQVGSGTGSSAGSAASIKPSEPKPANKLAQSVSAVQHHQESTKANPQKSNHAVDQKADDTPTLKLGPLAAHPHLVEKALRSTAVAQAERVAMATEFTAKNKAADAKKTVVKTDEKPAEKQSSKTKLPTQATQESQQRAEVLGQAALTSAESSRNGNEPPRINPVLQKDPNSVNALVSALTGKAPLVEKPYLNSRKRNSKMIKAKAKAEAKSKHKAEQHSMDVGPTAPKVAPAVKKSQPTNKQLPNKGKNTQVSNVKDMGIKETAVKEAVKVAAANAARAVEEALKEQAKAKAKVAAKQSKHNATQATPSSAAKATKPNAEKNKPSRNNKPMVAPLPLAYAPSLLPKLEAEPKTTASESTPQAIPDAPDPSLVNAFAGLIGKKP